MMEAVRGWLLTLISVSLACALADALMPRGAVKQAGRLVCGLALTLAVLTPLARLDPEAGARWLEDCLEELDLREEALSQEVNGQMKVIIEGDFAAYIVDKAAQMGVSCQAEVECRAAEEGLYLPCRVEVTGLLSEEARSQLTGMIARDLGVPAQEQSYVEEDVP